LRAFIPISDPIILVANDDGVVAQVEQARLLGQLLFMLLALAQIHDRGLVKPRSVSRCRSNRRTNKKRRNPLALSRLQRQLRLHPLVGSAAIKQMPQ